MTNHSPQKSLKQHVDPKAGFTLVELMIGMVVTTLLTVVMVSTYVGQQKISKVIKQASYMQQQLRGAMYLMEQDIRVAGYDPKKQGVFGVLDCRRWRVTNDQTAATLDINGSPSLTITADLDGDGNLNDATPSYRLFDDNDDDVAFNDQNDGAWDLARDINGERQLLAQGIEAIGFAYAIDNTDTSGASSESDGQLDRTPGGHIIWAVDSDNDNDLDTNLDTNDDGLIDANDAGGDNRITFADGAAGALNNIALDRIRAVRIWILARAPLQDTKYENREQYVVGDQVLGPFNDGYHRRLLVRTIEMRNAGLGI